MNLDRLTERNGDSVFILSKVTGWTRSSNWSKPAQEAIDRLAAYEDSGLTPEQVQELAKAEADGRLVGLPCKVGDTVFTIELDCKDNPDHSQMCFCWDKSCKECDKSYLRVWENRNKTADIRSIVAEMGLCGESGGFGKTVFLTRAEAEAALKGEEKMTK